MKNTETKAKRLATKAHFLQKRKDNKTPYITHPAAVVEILKGIGVTDHATLAVAWLHDIVEDTTYFEMSDIEERFEPNVAKGVEFMTRFKWKNESREEYLNKITCKAPLNIQKIKLADVLHNLRTIYSIADFSTKIKAAENKLNEKKAYLRLARKICPALHKELVKAYAKLDCWWKKNQQKIKETKELKELNDSAMVEVDCDCGDCDGKHRVTRREKRDKEWEEMGEVLEFTGDVSHSTPEQRMKFDLELEKMMQEKPTRKQCQKQNMDGAGE